MLVKETFNKVEGAMKKVSNKKAHKRKTATRQRIPKYHRRRYEEIKSRILWASRQVITLEKLRKSEDMKSENL